jgi:hypothetical protein
VGDLIVEAYKHTYIHLIVEAADVMANDAVPLLQ